MFIKPISLEVKDAESSINIGTYDQVINERAPSLLPLNIYQIYAPVIGHANILMGKPRNKPEYIPSLTKILGWILSDNYEYKKEVIIEECKQYEIASSVIYQLLHNLQQQNQPWNEHKKEVLSRFKTIILDLIKHGARWLHIEEINESIFQDLVDLALTPKELSAGLANIELGGNLGFGIYQKKVNFYLNYGVDINTVSSINPNYGTFLHIYLAYELHFAKKLIDFIESKRNGEQVTTCYNYENRDSYGKTPLLIAILTRQESVALKLLNLSKKDIRVGINIPDNDGRYPLLVAVALGMVPVVKALLKNDANPLVRDSQGRDIHDYAQLNETCMKEMLLPLLNPDRGETITHSYLYWNDEIKSPLTLYGINESEKSGDAQCPHLVLLSPLDKHQQRIKVVIDCILSDIKINKVGANELLDYVKNQTSQIGNITFLERCMIEQKSMQKFLRSQAGRSLIQVVKEFQLRRACALSDVDVVETLVTQGINPNSTDPFQRTALHYTVMRSELVRKEWLAKYAELGTISMDLKDDELAIIMNRHAHIIEILHKHSMFPIDLDVRNKAGNSVEDILLRESKKRCQSKTDHLDVEMAEKCLSVILSSKSLSLKKT